MTYNVKVEINIPETGEKGNSPLGKRIFVPTLIIFVGSLAFGAIKLANIEAKRQPVTVEYGASALSALATSTTQTISATSSEKTSATPALTSGKYVAARGGTAYYLPTCAASKRITEKNKIWFETRAEAEKFGYKPAKNCPGLK